MAINSKIKKIKEFGKYWISDKGIVLSGKWGRIRPLKGRKNSYGYMEAILSKNKKIYVKKIHRLVCKAFKKNPLKKPFVNHLNGIKSDNRIENLEWCTAKENVNHAMACGLLPQLGKGEANHMSKLTIRQIKKIRQLFKKKDISLTKLSKIFGVAVSTIWFIKNNYTWKDV